MPYYEINRLQQIYSNSYLQAFDCKLKSTFIYNAGRGYEQNNKQRNRSSF